MKIACFVVVNHFGAEDTYKMYRSILEGELGSAHFDFVVVDNSVDVSELEKLSDIFSGYENAYVVTEKENKGYFSGLNSGIEFCSPCKYRYICVGNNDLLFDENFLKILAEKNYSDDVYAVCPDVVTSDGFHQNPHVVEPMGWKRKLKLDLYYSFYFMARLLSFAKSIFFPRKVNKKCASGCYIHMGIGAFYVLTPLFFKKNEKLDYPFFLYGEEAFLSNQVICSGGKMYYDPDLIVFHEESATLSKTPSHEKYKWARASYKVHRGFL